MSRTGTVQEEAMKLVREMCSGNVKAGPMLSFDMFFIFEHAKQLMVGQKSWDACHLSMAAQH